MPMPKISTIICNYNYEKYIIECIESAMNQETKYIHSVVFVDDGSTDKSWDLICKKYKPESSTIKYLNNQMVTIWQFKNLSYTRITNSGASQARNMAIAIAGDVDAISILDSDDFMLPNKINVLGNKLFEYSEVGVVYADYERRFNGLSKIEHKQSYSMNKLQSNCIIHSGAMIKKEYLDLVSKDGKYYNPALHGPASKSFRGACEDYDLWLRLSRVCIICHIPQILTIVNEHQNNQSKKVTPEIFQENIKIIRENLKQTS